MRIELTPIFIHQIAILAFLRNKRVTLLNKSVLATRWKRCFSDSPSSNQQGIPYDDCSRNFLLWEKNLLFNFCIFSTTQCLWFYHWYQNCLKKTYIIWKLYIRWSKLKNVLTFKAFWEVFYFIQYFRLWNVFEH